MNWQRFSICDKIRHEKKIFYGFYPKIWIFQNFYSVVTYRSRIFIDFDGDFDSRISLSKCEYFPFSLTEELYELNLFEQITFYGQKLLKKLQKT